MPPSGVYRELDKRWRQTCSLVFGADVGELARYSGWLTRHAERGARRKSALSDKEIFAWAYAKYSEVPHSRTVTEEEARSCSIP